ncbi:1-acyl-sn-glycerol-3-phosphate acyltransferase [Flavobacteriaceae bacterium]|nr:1-acyl-sn-glycerol-3-phosphate acyltransferase [Flavobacteriaceae bacterium]MDB4773340.1 1-acyl-sn-glycerol-3-phosphate acyltransferase [Flavobacteriaceae bacterium]
MYKFIATIFSSIFALSFLLILVLFHGIQVVLLNLFGYQAHKVSVDLLNFFLVKSFYLVGSRIKFKNVHELPTDRPLIIVANHQNTFDIPPLIWYLRKHHLKFVSKIELGRGIPSVSYHLRNGGSALIDRKNPRQAVTEINKHAQLLSKNNWSTLIFPEGTRSKMGVPKKFKTRGLKTLIEKIPNVLIVPVTINNSYKFNRWGNFPVPLGIKLTLEVHTPVEPEKELSEEFFDGIEKTITDAIVLD